MPREIQNLEEFKTVDQLKKELKVLKMENIAAMRTIEKLLKDLSQKTEQLTQMESLVAAAVPVVKKETSALSINLTPEEEIATLQLDRLRTAAKVRSLTLEETRMYDLLVKNKRLSQDESTINLSKKHYRDVTDAELLQIASKQEQIPDGDQ